MALALVFILIAFGAAQAQVVVAQKSVTLQWLRLGDLISLPLLTLGIVMLLRGPGLESPVARATGCVAVFLLLSALSHITLVHLGKRRGQRNLNIFVIGAVTLFLIAGPFVPALGLTFPIGLQIPIDASTATGGGSISLNASAIAVSQVLSAFLLGGSIMTMMLGHAYLTAGGAMTQQPFLRLTRWLGMVILVRALLAIAAGALPYYAQYRADELENVSLVWPMMLITARFAVGFVVPGVMVWMALQCVKIRSNQSATGILYVTGLMLLIGELTALALWAETGLAF